jgi:hypothetical protein
MYKRRRGSLLERREQDIVKQAEVEAVASFFILVFGMREGVHQGA